MTGFPQKIGFFPEGIRESRFLTWNLKNKLLSKRRLKSTNSNQTSRSYKICQPLKFPCSLCSYQIGYIKSTFCPDTKLCSLKVYFNYLRTTFVVQISKEKACLANIRGSNEKFSPCRRKLQLRLLSRLFSHLYS